ncbi:MAG: hypothetical protein IPI77_19615 [Saprospiraceae bacterium]|nr:hypothetical protein [Saprospiraceae bacterium]
MSLYYFSMMYARTLSCPGAQVSGILIPGGIPSSTLLLWYWMEISLKKGNDKIPGGSLLFS